MGEQIITSSKEILKRYKARPTQAESTPDNIICGYCGKPKKQMGRYWFCVTCRNIKLPSGKSASKISREILLKAGQK